jgi:hypothetical protein
MSDTGSSAGLTIPARKAIEMGLTPGTHKSARITAKRAGNEVFARLMMFPEVLLEVQFERPDGTVESRVCITHAWCHEDEYFRCLERPEAEEKAQAAEEPQAEKNPKGAASESTNSESACQSPETLISPNSKRNLAGKIPLKRVSPIKHRPEGNPDDRATIGMKVLREMRIHINCEASELEIEEEHTFIED